MFRLPSNLALLSLVLATGCSNAPAPPASPASPAPVDSGSAATSAAAPKAAPMAAPTASSPKPASSAGAKTCADDKVPAGPGGACVKTCQADAACAKGEHCLPTSWDMGGGQMAHDKACF